MLKGFRDFILRGNVVELAVAVILGTAFNAIVGSMVKDVLNPLIAATIGQPDFSAVVLHLGKGVIQIGNFLNAVVAFLIVAGVVYFAIVLPMNAVSARIKRRQPPAPEPPPTKVCGECLSEIPAAARRCAHCAQLVA
ncbi:MAG TPA: large conductance mechanosensitive channel protein MscL [Terracidiphilus sp.]|nr:large conductance mechanosensitive channel protein MscL [Terracidiphilus sp.]